MLEGERSRAGVWLILATLPFYRFSFAEEPLPKPGLAPAFHPQSHGFWTT